MLNHAFFMRQDIETARRGAGSVEEEICHQVALLEAGGKDFAAEKAPGARQRRGLSFQAGEIGRDFGQDQRGLGLGKSFGWLEAGFGERERVVQGLGVGVGIMVKVQVGARVMSQFRLNAAGVEPPIDLESVAFKAGVQAVAHFAIEVGQVGIADGAQAGDVEQRVAAEQGVIRPGCQAEALLAEHLPLGLFEGKADACAAVFGVNAKQVRAVFGLRAIGQGVEAGKARKKADESFAFVCAEYQPAIVGEGEQDVRGDNFNISARPNKALQVFHFGHFGGGF